MQNSLRVIGAELSPDECILNVEVVDKNGETLNFKYSFPDANKILDDHHISVKFVAV